MSIPPYLYIAVFCFILVIFIFIVIITTMGSTTKIMNWSTTTIGANTDINTLNAADEETMNNSV